MSLPYRILIPVWQWEKEGVTTLRLSIISTMLTLIFIVEVLMKVIAFTLRGYWQSRRNRYDLYVSLMGEIGRASCRERV